MRMQGCHCGARPARRPSARKGCRREKAVLLAFLPFVYGVYPYSAVTEKQRMAMDQAEMRYNPPAQHEMVRQGAAMLLGI